MLDPSFLEAVKSLLSPWTGTELMAPLLDTLARFTRARTVLEGGSGYTTPFLAKALADNAYAVEEERRAMQEKTARYVADLDAMQDTPAPVEPGTKVAPGLLALYNPTSPVAKRRLEWLGETPGFARPARLERRLHAKTHLRRQPLEPAKFRAQGAIDYRESRNVRLRHIPPRRFLELRSR